MKGSAIVTALILIVIGSLIIGGYLLFISRENQMAKRINDSVKALYIAEAGLERKLYEIKNGNYDDIPITYFPDVGDTESYYTVDVVSQGAIYIVTSTGTYHTGDRKVRQNVSVFNFWDLAVFSGGATTGQISGNTQIRGTVYVLGEESFVDTNENSLYDDGIDTLIDENVNGIRDHLNSSDYAINGTGTFYIGNDYVGFGGNNPIPAEFLNRIPSVSTLDAGVNVKYGKTVLGSGSAQIGNATVPMDLVNVPDGFIPEDPTGRVFVEEGGLLYDRGMFNEKIRFPSLYDIVGGQTRMSALQGSALVLTSGVDIPEDITPATNISHQSGENKFIIDGSGHMTIEGVVYINGNLTFDKYQNDRTIWYTGKGSMVLTGNLTININLYTQETGPSAYPEHNIIGFMTPGNIDLGAGGTGGLEIMAIFYAGGLLRTMKSTSVAGTFISSHVDMSQNVPEIFQVVNIKDNLPPGMINIPPVVATYSWREVFGED